MPSNTRKKFNEAQFFLELMDLNCNSFPNFNYYVSAFISAARSVTWIMGCEYNDQPGWKEWFKSREPTEVDDEFLKMTNKIRIKTVKTTPIQTNFCVTLNIPPEEVTPQLKEYFKSLKPKELAELLVNKNDNAQDTLIEGRKVLSFDESVHTTMYVDGFPKHDIRQLGHKYIDFLLGLLDECEGKFTL